MCVLFCIKFICFTFYRSCGIFSIFSAKCYLKKYNCSFFLHYDNIYNEVMQKLTLLNWTDKTCMHI